MDKEKNYLEVEGESVEDAIKKGMELLKTNAENVDIEILNEPINGFLKFGRKKARVRLTLLRGTVPAHLLKSEENPVEPVHKKHDRISVQEVLEHKNKDNAEEKKRDEKVNAFRQYREQRQQAQRENPQPKKSQEAHQQNQSQSRRPESRPPQNQYPQHAPQTYNEPQEAEPPYEATEEDNANIGKISAIFMKLTGLMGFNVEPEISALGNKYRIIIKDTPDASLLIGKNGKTIEALQHIVNKISLKEEVNKPVYLDIKGYVKQKRKNKFEKRWKR
ncbi:MAG: Jag N-terminal domain-containing protein [bacterium]